MKSCVPVLLDHEAGALDWTVHDPNPTGTRERDREQRDVAGIRHADAGHALRCPGIESRCIPNELVQEVRCLVHDAKQFVGTRCRPNTGRRANEQRVVKQSLQLGHPNAGRRLCKADVLGGPSHALAAIDLVEEHQQARVAEYVLEAGRRIEMRNAGDASHRMDR